MKKAEDAKFIETTIPNNDMRAFVCETTKDLQLFLSEVKYTSWNAIPANRGFPIIRVLCSVYEPGERTYLGT